jgi:hypothetical protein
MPKRCSDSHTLTWVAARSTNLLVHRYNRRITVSFASLCSGSSCCPYTLQGHARSTLGIGFVCAFSQYDLKYGDNSLQEHINTSECPLLIGCFCGIPYTNRSFDDDCGTALHFYCTRRWHSVGSIKEKQSKVCRASNETNIQHNLALRNHN